MMRTANLSHDELWGYRASADARFGPTLDGQFRWWIVEEHYIQNKDATYQLWDANDDPLVARHRLNPRKQIASVDEWVPLFFKNGLMSVMRSRMIGIPPDDSEGDRRELARRMVGGATVTNVVYKARVVDPQNRSVQHALKKHITGVLDLKKGVPDDMITWIKNQSPSYDNQAK